MVNYVNSYSIASDADHETLVINFLQRFPEVMPAADYTPRWHVISPPSYFQSFRAKRQRRS